MAMHETSPKSLSSDDIENYRDTKEGKDRLIKVAPGEWKTQDRINSDNKIESKKRMEAERARKEDEHKALLYGRNPNTHEPYRFSTTYDERKRQRDIKNKK